ncbi:hypothetical protein BDV18DRAFT_157249 [Aspergillus unguis]
MAAFKVIVIGAGLIGPRHAQSIQAHPDTILAAFVDPSPAAIDVAATFNVPCYASLQALLDSKDPKPDAAIVCTPNHTHVPIALELLHNGVYNILLEKPISDSLESAEKLLAELTSLKQDKSKKVNILVGHHRRFNPYVQSTKSLLDSNSLGNIIAVNGLWTLLKPPSYFQGIGSWRADKEKGGVLGINLIHDVDVLHYLFGPIIRVFAEGTTPQRSNAASSLDEKNHTAEEGCAITLRFASGVVGTFLICDGVPSPLNFETGTGENPTIPGVSEGASDCYRIFGSRASLSVPDMTRWSYDSVPGEKGWNSRLDVQRKDVEGKDEKPFDRQWRHFVKVLHGEEEVACAVGDGVQALRVVRAVKDSMESGKVVDVHN